jgi:hypothetical protein
MYGFLGDAVERNADFRQVIQKSVATVLCWKHRQEREKQCTAGHCMHVAEIGAAAYQNVRPRVLDCSATLHGAAVEFVKVMRMEHHAGSVFYNLGPSIDGVPSSGRKTGRGAVSGQRHSGREMGGRAVAASRGRAPFPS